MSTKPAKTSSAAGRRVEATKPARLRDVAATAQVSHAVASKVLNGVRGNIKVSTATRQRVIKVASELGYRPNFAAQSLVTRRTRTLGCYIAPLGPTTGVGNSFEGTLLAGAERACQKAGYHILLMNWLGTNDPDVCLQHLREGRIDGLLLLRVPEDDQWVSRLADETDRVAAVDYLGAETRLDAATFDHDAAVGIAVDHLVGLGYRKIGWIGCSNTDHNQVQRRRLEGFRAAMNRHRLPISEEWIYDYQFAPTPQTPEAFNYLQASGAHAVQHYASLGEQTRPTATVAAVFLSAIGVVQHATQYGLDVSRDLSVVGVGDRPWCAYTSPPLTNVANPLFEMGEWTAQWLIEKAGERATSTGHREGIRKNFSPCLFQRESTAPPA